MVATRKTRTCKTSVLDIKCKEIVLILECRLLLCIEMQDTCMLKSEIVANVRTLANMQNANLI